MIWATVSSLSCFCWLYRPSPSLAAKNIINLISVLTIWWCWCVIISCKRCLLWPTCFLDKNLLAFALLHFVLQTYLLLQVSLDFLLSHSNPLWWKGSLFGVSYRRSYRSSQKESTSASSASVVGVQTWITVILNGLPCKRTEIILLFLKLHSSTTFWTLLLTMRAIPFLLRDFCPQ